jgi:hypothetical protein
MQCISQHDDLGIKTAPQRSGAVSSSPKVPSEQEHAPKTKPCHQQRAKK